MSERQKEKHRDGETGELENEGGRRWGERERETETERQRQRDRERDRDRDRQTDRQTYRQTDRQTETQRHRQRDRAIAVMPVLFFLFHGNLKRTEWAMKSLTSVNINCFILCLGLLTGESKY